ncbi:MAG: serine kinase [Bacteroidales bacterium]|nr:serine kinase [Bacteroidales bacterium]MBN2819001.1 serine kinase [Bacteroidales bacterium]
MKLTEVVNKLELEVICGEDLLENTVTGGYCSDLLSDVMGNAQEGQVWLTIQVHNNIIAVASLKELSAILLVKGLKPGKETIETAIQQGIPILRTNETAFEIAGRLYNLIRQS